MRDTVLIAVVAVLAIAGIAIAGIATGHNDAVISGSIATIAGIAGGLGAYKASKSKYPRWHDERVKKEEKKDD